MWQSIIKRFAFRINWYDERKDAIRDFKRIRNKTDENERERRTLETIIIGKH